MTPGELDASGAAADESPYELRVQQVTWEAEGIISLRLVHPEGKELPRWEAGAHIDLILPSGLIRQYSLSGSVDDHFSYRVSVLNELNSRGGSREIHDTPLAGKMLMVRGPRNHFHLSDDSRFIFIAGGIGVTPILPMIREVERRGVPWTLVYGGRSRQTMAFLDEIAELSSGKVDLVPEEELGYPDLDAILQAVTPGTAVFTCGPPGMLAAIEERAAKYLPTGALHLERFSAPDGAVAPELTGDDDTFEVELARKGVTITVGPDRTLLRAIRDVIPSILYSCEEGYCGTCEVKVLEGVPDHRDTILSDEERESNKTIMVCVSRSKSPKLVLDL
jgi:ferredoxin-NADP reductase